LTKCQRVRVDYKSSQEAKGAEGYNPKGREGEMPSITPVSQDNIVALKRQTEVRPYFFDSTDKDELRPIYTAVTTYIRAVNDEGDSISQWEATDNFTVKLTVDEAEALLKHLTEAIAQAKDAGF
jgi:hypothetical protein